MQILLKMQTIPLIQSVNFSAFQLNFSAWSLNLDLLPTGMLGIYIVTVIWWHIRLLHGNPKRESVNGEEKFCGRPSVWACYQNWWHTYLKSISICCPFQTGQIYVHLNPQIASKYQLLYGAHLMKSVASLMTVVRMVSTQPGMQRCFELGQSSDTTVDSYCILDH